MNKITKLGNFEKGITHLQHVGYKLELELTQVPMSQIGLFNKKLLRNIPGRLEFMLFCRHQPIE